MTEDLDGRRWQAERFETHRDRLHAVAYRMLGSSAEADDAVQEAWLRLDRAADDIDNLGGWLTTVVGRVCIDMLRARRARREEPAGAWLPESIVSLEPDGDPEQQSLIAGWVAENGSPFATGCRPALINGAIGILMATKEGPAGVVHMKITGDRIAKIEVLFDPAALRGRTADAGET